MARYVCEVANASHVRLRCESDDPEEDDHLVMLSGSPLPSRFREEVRQGETYQVAVLIRPADQAVPDAASREEGGT
jgi:hypothetical protein